MSLRTDSEVLGEPSIELAEIPAHRWHRWTDRASGRADAAALGPIAVDLAPAHAGVRAPFAFPDGAVLDLVLTPSGWRRRR